MAGAMHFLKHRRRKNVRKTVAFKLIPILALVTLSACGNDDASTETAADTASQTDATGFIEGTHYDRLDPPQPTVADDGMIEVSEVFWYGCHHCANLEAPLKAWVTDAPDSVRFVYIPATWNQTASIHAQVHYTIKQLAADGAIDGEEVHAAVYEAIHLRGNRLLRPEDIESFFSEFGVDAAALDAAWNSTEVGESLELADELRRNYRIEAVPTIIINGAYRTSRYMAGDDLFDVMDELIAREEAAR